MGVGTRFSGTYSRAGQVSLELVEFVPPNRLTFRARSRIVDFDDAIELDEADGVTRLSARMTAQPRGLMRLMSPLMARTMRAQFESNWAHLKPVLEGSEEHRPPDTGGSAAEALRR